MSYGLSLVTRKLFVPALAVVVGAAMYAPSAMVQDGSCRSFEGGLSGNDPDAEAVLVLCRSDDLIYGRLRVEGQSGVSVGEIAGELKGDRRAVLVDTAAVVAEPSDGWLFCFDDVYELRWDPFARRLTGTYRSEQCDDTGTIVVLPGS